MRYYNLKSGVRLFLSGLVVLLVGFGLWFAIDQNSTEVKHLITTELGAPLTVNAVDFFTRLSKNAQPEIISDLQVIDTMHLGSYPIQLKLQGRTYNSELNIVDTTAPKVEVKTRKVEVNSTLTPQELIGSISDLQSTTIEFKKIPALTKVGQETITLVVKDASGNTTEVPVTITVVFDLTNPVIDATKTLYLKVGTTTVDYWAGVVVSDAKSTIASKSSDASKVKLNRRGDYIVTLSATDSAGNTAKVTRKVAVVLEPTFLTMQALAHPDHLQVDGYIQTIFDQITKPTMTLMQKTRAIYDWIRTELTYRTDAATAYESDAYNYLDDYAEIMATTYKGHCFHYASIAALLLNKLGLEMTLVKGKGYSSTALTHFVLHYWMMVKIDGVYYHFDPLYQYLFEITAHRTINFYLVKDADIYDITHRWDQAYYPTTQ